MEMQKFLNEQGINFDSSETKVELYRKIKPMRHRFNVYAVDETLRKAGIECVRLPPYHCMFNLIEIIWSSYKAKVRKMNVYRK